MTDQERLPAKITIQDLVLLTEQSGSLVTRGLEAIKKRDSQLLSLTIEPDLEELFKKILPDCEDLSMQGICKHLALIGIHTLEDLCVTGGAYFDRGDNDKGLACLLAAAKLDSGLAQHTLGVIYAVGQGVPQDDFEARKWSRKAADHGFDTQPDVSRLEQRRELLGRIREGAVFEGVVKKITEYGAFIDLGGLDGLLHVTDISWQRINHPSEVLHIGQNIKVVVIKFDQADKRISLGMKQLKKSPWEEGAYMKYSVGTHADGKITQINDYGAFVELEPGIEGLVHISEIPQIKENAHPSELVSIGQQVNVIVLWVEPSRQRMALSMKQYEDRFYENLLEGEYREGHYESALGTARYLAEKENIIAQYYLGLMYEFGLGVTQYDVDAMKWYRKAAKQGHAASQFKLGFMYFFRKGVAFELDPDFDAKAAKWYRKSADQGYAGAQHNLAIMYTNGKGDEPQTSYALDLVHAYKWYSLAVKCTQPSEIEAREASIKACKNLASTMTKEKIAEAERLVSEWKPK